MRANGNGTAGNGAAEIQVADAGITAQFTPVVTIHGATLDLTSIGKDSRNPRYEVYLSGWAAAYEARESEVARLRWERDLWYFVASNPGKTPADFYRHETAELWRVAA